MICDRLKYAAFYYGAQPRFKRALEYLEQTDFAAVAAGKYEIEGQDIYAIVQEYLTKPAAEGRWEAHRRYIDIQYVVSGAEFIGYADIDTLKPGEYDATKDVIFLEGQGLLVPVPAGKFMVLGPQDAHQPQIAISHPIKVRKVVVKIKV